MDDKYKIFSGSEQRAKQSQAEDKTLSDFIKKVNTSAVAPLFSTQNINSIAADDSIPTFPYYEPTKQEKKKVEIEQYKSLINTEIKKRILSELTTQELIMFKQKLDSNNFSICEIYTDILNNKADG